MRIQAFLDGASAYCKKTVYIIIDDLDQELSVKSNDMEEYKFLITSLIRAVEFVNSNVIFSKSIIFMREDIFYSLPRISKWRDVRIRMSWPKSKIYNLLIAKIRHSSDVDLLSDQDTLSALFFSPEMKNASGKKISTIEHVINYSQLRPRDVIGYIQIAAELTKNEADKLTLETLREALPEYSEFMAQGIYEELEWHYPDKVDNIYDAISDCGNISFTYGVISTNLKRHLKCDEKYAFDIILKLYEFGIIGNHFNMKKYFSFTEPRIDLNVNRNIVVHQSVQKKFGF